MQSQPQGKSQRLRVEDEFRELLRSKWTRPVACQNECSPPDACRCQREIVHVQALDKWWDEPLSESPGQTKGHQFIDEMHVPPHRKLPLSYKGIFTGEERCRRVLGLLLQQKRDLIDLFSSATMKDMYLVRSEDDRNLRDILLEKLRAEEVEAIIGDFHRDKWAYCPMNLTLGMEFNGNGTKVIPPFCWKVKLPDKGATASIYWVAVQKDLISDPALVDALRESLYYDEKHGECYQMILKSFSGNKKGVFELEKQAFAGLNSDGDVPILKFLGSYTHDYGEGKHMGKTYNMLLEYGDNDLYQAWADETNVPPVRAQEILRTWNALFEIAKAIRHVHHLEVPRSDIKPDNILSIRGRLKLSDFGYSSFAPVIKGRNRSVPTELIRGFTDTYAAPELFRMTNADGTLSGVTQTIDTWSFGCVLSVAATWIVLGFQGIRQYEQLRQLAPSNCQNKEIHDRFHDGVNVLPEIRKWHNYLRGHLRPSDTTTESVLDLIENHLLRADPSERPDSEELCEKLQSIHKFAESEISSLRKHSKETDAMVLRALSEIENKARKQRAPEMRTSLVLLQQLMSSATANPQQWTSMPLQKDAMIKSRPFGQTPYRKEILRQELGESITDPPDSGNSVYGAAVQSPVTGHLKELQIPGRQPKPMNPHFQGASQQRRAVQRHTADNEGDGPSATPTTPTPHQRLNMVRGDNQRDPMASSGPYGSLDSQKPGRTMEISPAATSQRLPASFQQSTSNALSLLQIVTQPFPLSHPYTSQIMDFRYEPRFEQSPLEEDAREESSTQNEVPKLASPFPGDSAGGDKQWYDPAGLGIIRPDTASTSYPIPKLEPVDSVTGNEDVKVSSPNVYDRGKEVVEGPGSATSKEAIKIAKPIPSSILELPYSICERRAKLDKEKAKGLAKITNMIPGHESRRADPSLRGMANDRRELVFIIDNGCTMFKHWQILIFIVETLAMNAAGIDKSGIDLLFTVDGKTHDLRDIARDSGRRELTERLRKARPEYKQTNNVTTDMVTIFHNVYKEWERKNKPATTLYVFTDGKWIKEHPAALQQVSKTPKAQHDILVHPPPLHESILRFAREEPRTTGNRHFSIQFIRFGDDATDRRRLQWLDDTLCSIHGLRDIVDHCSWRAPVDKIFKGSIEGEYDENNDDDDDQRPIPYDYDQLVKKFYAFNNKGDDTRDDAGRDAKYLTPSSPSPLHRTPSLHSGRSSMSAPRNRDSMSPETPKRQSKGFSFFI